MRKNLELLKRKTLKLYYSRVTIAHGSSIASQSAASFLEELSPIPTLKTTRGHHGKHENVARELTSAECLASTKKRVANGRREGVGEKRTATANASHHNAYCICPVCSANYYDEN
ncbi:hypothetical protein TNCV_2189571 [Trichonephila clavipes]|nr:hypothetical protein TNCV_2189571 [Trichonephila clavipes]